MILYLLRHAKAEPQGSKPDDSERRLIPKGKEKCVKRAHEFKDKLAKVELILSSPYPRAAETAEIFATILGKKDCLKHDEALAGGSAAFQILRHLNHLNLDQTTMLVGHETWMSQLTSIMISGTPECQIDFKKCGLIKLNVSHFEPRGAFLKGLW